MTHVPFHTPFPYCNWVFQPHNPFSIEIQFPVIKDTYNVSYGDLFDHNWWGLFDYKITRQLCSGLHSTDWNVLLMVFVPSLPWNDDLIRLTQHDCPCMYRISFDVIISFNSLLFKTKSGWWNLASGCGMEHGNETNKYIINNNDND